jgi:uncharacterized protein (DUF1015 family)
VATVSPLRGVRFDPGRVELGRVLAPPYDVISDAQREQLYAQDPHNIVRIDYGREEPGDTAGVEDRYTRAAAQLQSWQAEGVLRRDGRPAVYVHDHAFTGVDGSPRVRRGIHVRVPALPWEQSEVLPHERTMRGPKEDRLRLMRATRTQTSPVFALWDRAPGMAEALDAATGRDPDATAAHCGEVGPEQHRLWVVDGGDAVASILEALGPARLYIADGHHRFETAAAYAAERRAAEPDAAAGADFAMTLLWLCGADDDALEVLPTHRLVLPGPGIPSSLGELLPRLGDRFTVEPQPSLESAVTAAAARRETDHAIAVAGRDGAALLTAPRRFGGSARAGLDVSVVQDEVLGRGCGLDPDAVAGGAVAYTRSVAGAQAAVADGGAALAVCVNGCTTAEIIAVSDAGETMPQKSTYFHPKVPTGLVLSPL